MSESPDDATLAPKRRRKSPATSEDYERRLHAMAYEVAEEQLRDRSISSQTLTHLLKEGSIRGQLELEEKRQNNLLTEAKIKNLEQLGDIVELLKDAKTAMTTYQMGMIPDTPVIDG